MVNLGIRYTDRRYLRGVILRGFNFRDGQDNREQLSTKPEPAPNFAAEKNVNANGHSRSCVVKWAVSDSV